MFWNTFSQLCKENGTNASQVVKSLNIGAGSVTKWKNGAMPSGRSLEKIADYFGITVDYLLGKTDIKEKAPAKGESTLTEAEQKLLEMYRGLDDAGKITVGTVLKKEFDRVARHKGLIPSVVAARSADDSETVHTEYLPDLSKIPADDTDL